MFKEFHNLRLEHLRCQKEQGILAAFGYRTCIVMDNEMNPLCKFLDANKEERYHCGEFFESKMKEFCSPNQHFLALGGKTGIIKILDIKEGSLVGFLSGHTGAICDIKIFENFILSAGEDSSIRLWDLKKFCCIGVCAGMFGHKDHVLSIDVLFDKSLIVSSGTDCVIKQWKLDGLGKEYLNYDPFTSFSNIHRCPINKVRYYGNMIVSLCNNAISMVYNSRERGLAYFNLSRNDPIFIGSIELFNNCKTFEIETHTLIGMGTNGDVYVFDLRSIAEEKTPFLIPTNAGTADDFTFMDGYMFISSGNVIYKISLDLDRFQ